MRIRKIEFTNINNLRGGPHIISFDDAPLLDAGIFAITGPTGSGKSTILDVITLALYNRIPRHGRVSKKSMLDHGSVLTYHADAASASVLYEVDGRSYTSIWSIEKARTGNLKDYEMAIIDQEGSYLDFSKAQVPDANASIIGLNYDQFVKSIILSQGEFARFLKASKNERGEMLERLTGTELYRKLGIKVYYKSKEANAELKSQKELVEEIQLLDKEEMQFLRNEVEQLRKKIQKTSSSLKTYLALIKTKEDVHKLDNKVKEIEELRVKNKALFSINQPNWIKLSSHEEVAEFEREITLWETSHKNLLEREQAIQNAQQKKGALQEEIAEFLKSATILCGTIIDLNNYKVEIEAFVQKVEEIVRSLNRLKEKGREERKAVNNLLENSSFDIEMNAKPEGALRLLSNHLKQLTLELEKHASFDSNISVEELKSNIDANLDALQKAKMQGQIEKQINTLKGEVEKENSQYRQLQVEIGEITPRLHKELEVKNLLNENRILLSKQKEDRIAIQSLEEFRNVLEDGEACPLCGSVHHPYLHEKQDFNISDIDLKLADLSRRSNQTEEEISSLEKKLSQIEATCAYLQKNMIDKKEKVKKLMDEMQDQSFKIVPEYSDVEAYVKKKEKEVAALRKELVMRQQLLEASALQEAFEKLKSTLEAYRQQEIEKADLYKGADVRKEGNKLVESILTNLNTLQQLEIAKGEHTLKRDQHKEEIIQVEMVLQKVLAKFNFKDIEELKAQLLPKGEAEQLKITLKNIETDKLTLQAQLDTISKQLNEIKIKDNQPDISIEMLKQDYQIKEEAVSALNTRLAAVIAKLNQNEIAKNTYDARMRSILDLEKSARKWSLLNQTIGSANGDVFANYAQGLTLNNLISITNRRLQDLTDRYLLDRPGDDGTMSVIDLYQGNSARAVTTLSGGEVFILSLALALSLSDMASQNVALESLFIDEGFGTLDQETLDVAMSTLEKLQSDSKKQVGIISHVEALKERITTQIQLKKDAQGYSKLAIVSSSHALNDA